MGTVEGTVQSHSQARWQDGYDARYKGKTESDNPYRRSSQDFHFWQDGWLHAEAEILAETDDER